MSSNGNSPAHPMWTYDMPIEGSSGMSKREEFAKAAMQALLTEDHQKYSEVRCFTIAKSAVRMADALIEELEKSGDKG